MSIAELTEKVQFVIDAEGNRQAVQINIESWENLLTLIGDMEDELLWDEQFARSPEVLERLADEAQVEIEAGHTRELDPDSL